MPVASRFVLLGADAVYVGDPLEDALVGEGASPAGTAKRAPGEKRQSRLSTQIQLDVAGVPALIAGGEADQLPYQLGRALENGVTEIELLEAITHLAFYAGWPKAITAVTAAHQVLSAASEPG